MIDIWLPRTEAEIQYLKEWAARKLNESVSIFDKAYAYAAVEVDDETKELKRILCSIVLSHATKYDLHVSLAKESGWLMTPKMAKRLINIAFGQPWCPMRLSSLVDEGNSASLNLQKHLGFVQEGRKRNFFGERDAIILGLLADEWDGGE